MTRADDLVSPEPAIRRRAVAAIRENRRPTEVEVDRLFDLLSDADKGVQREAAAVIAALGADGADRASRLEALLGSEDARARWGAAYCQAVADRPTVLGLSVWVDHLGASDSDLRWAAHGLIVAAAGRLGAAVPAALHAVARGAAPQRAKMALYCLRDLGKVDAIAAELAVDALRSSEFEIRLAGLAALPVVEASHDRASATIAKLLGDDDPRIGRAAAAALGRLDSIAPAAADALDGAAHSADPALRRAATGALSRHRSTPS